MGGYFFVYGLLLCSCFTSTVNRAKVMSERSIYLITSFLPGLYILRS